MRPRITYASLFICLLLLAPPGCPQGSVACGQTITITGPSTPILPRDTVVLPVTGLTAVDLPLAQVGVDPTEGVTLIPAQYWGGQPFLMFTSRTPGKFTVTVSVTNVGPLPSWLTNLTGATQGVVAANVDTTLTAQLVTAQKNLLDRYSRRSGSCVVEVAGTVVPPPPPPPPPSNIDRVTYVFEKDANLVPRAVNYALQQINADKSLGILASYFEDDTVNGDGNVPEQYRIALIATTKERDLAKDPTLPCLIVQAGETVVLVVQKPTTEAAVYEAAGVKVSK